MVKLESQEDAEVLKEIRYLQRSNKLTAHFLTTPRDSGITYSICKGKTVFNPNVENFLFYIEPN